MIPIRRTSHSFYHILASVLVANVFNSVNFQDTNAQHVTYDTIILTGVNAPGTNPGVIISDFYAPPVLNNLGEITFGVELSGTGVSTENDTAMYSNVGGTISLVARADDPAPGIDADVTFTPSNNTTAINVPILTDDGRTVFWNGLAGPGVNRSNEAGIFSASQGSVGSVVRAGDAVPGEELDTVFASTLGLINPVANNVGQVAFFTYLGGPSVSETEDSAIVLDTNGTSSLVAREGDPAPGVGPDVIFGEMRQERHFHVGPVLNDNGQVAFVAGLTGNSVNGLNNQSIFMSTNDSLEVLARKGDVAPGTDSTATFGDFDKAPVINNSGRIAFRSWLRNPEGTSVSGEGIFSNVTGSLQLIAQTGQPAPVEDPGVVFEELEHAPVLNNAGHTAFLANLYGAGVDNTNDYGLFVTSENGLELVAREGDVAISSEPDVVFDRLENRAWPLLNDFGQIAFQASLDGPNVDSSNDGAIFATDTSGNLQLIAREGDLFDVNDDPLVTDERTIAGAQTFPFSGGSDGRQRAINNSGQLAFRLNFTDGTAGIFIATAGVRQLGDLNIDGDVDGADFLAWQRYPPIAGLVDWHSSYGQATHLPATALPEPSSLLSFLLASVVMLGVRQ